jgi:excisionase family DNA binding protein
MIKMTETLQMLTPKAVAGILGVHQKTVHLWLRNGKLKGVKISYRAWRIPQSALDQFIEQNSNLSPQTGTEDQKKVEIHGILSTNGSSELPAVNHDSPHTKMKDYIRDIMGEQSAGKNQSK